MANLSSLNTLISDMFGILKTLISEMVELMTGDLLVLAVVSSFIGFLLSVIALLFVLIKTWFTRATSKMK